MEPTGEVLERSRASKNSVRCCYSPLPLVRKGASCDQFLEAVKLQMQPEGRALHTVGMFQHLRTLLPNDVTLADLVAGWQMLAQPRNDTNSEVLHRRKTCAELATIAAQLTSDQGHLASAVSAWQAWLDAFRGSTDPRQVAMVSTFEREVLEL